MAKIKPSFKKVTNDVTDELHFSIKSNKEVANVLDKVITDLKNNVPPTKIKLTEEDLNTLENFLLTEYENSGVALDPDDPSFTFSEHKLNQEIQDKNNKIVTDERLNNMAASKNGWAVAEDGTNQHFVNGKLHDDPTVGYAELRPNGTVGHYKNGLIHNERGPAFVTNNGTVKYAIDGKYHRLGGLPAITWSRSKYHQEYWENGEIMRAVYKDGTQEWYAPGCTEKETARLSREDGPAVITSLGKKEFWLNGQRFISQEEWEFALNQKFKNGDAQKDDIAKTSINEDLITDSNSDKELNKNQGKKMSKPTLTEMMKSNATSAGYRVAAKQSTNLVKNAVVNLMKNKGADDGSLKGIAAFLDTELGAALISLAIGAGLNYVPHISEDGRVQRLAEEMRIDAMATAGNLVVGEAMNHLLPALSQVIQSLPALEEKETASAVRVEDAKSHKLAESLAAQTEEEDIVEAKTMNA